MVDEKLLKINGSYLLKLCIQNAVPSFGNLCEAIHGEEFTAENIGEVEGVDYRAKIETVAATRIQCLFRKYYARKRVRKIKLVLKKIILIQTHMRLFLNKKHTL